MCTQSPLTKPKDWARGGLLRWNGRSEGHDFAPGSGFEGHQGPMERGESMLTLFRGNSAFFWRCVMLTRDTREKLPCWALMSNLRYLFATAWGVSRSISNDAKHHSTG